MNISLPTALITLPTIALIAAYSPTSQAQTQLTPSASVEEDFTEPTETESRKNSLRFQGYGGASVQYSNMLGGHGVLQGIEGGVVLNRGLTLGLAGYVFGNPSAAPEFQDIPRNLEVGYAGVVLRHEFHINGPVYFSIGTLIGPGAIVATPARELLRNNDLNDEDPIDRRHIDIFTAIQSDVGIHANLTSWLRVGATVGYREAFGVDKFNKSNSDVNGLVAGGNIQFGSF